jgi:hypothetical protein
MAEHVAPIDDDDLPEPAAAKAAVKPAPAAKKPEPEPEPEPVAKKHTHTSRLVALARAAGFTQDDLDNHPSGVIWEELDRIGATAKPPAAKPEPKPAAPEVDPEEAYLAELEASHAPLVGMLRKTKAELAAIKKAQAEKDEQIGKLTAAEQKRADRMRERWLDNAFAALPEEYHELVGTGPLAKIDNPAHQGWRGAIYRSAGLTADDDAEAVAAKVLAAATAKAGPHAKKPPAAGAYDAAPARVPQKKDANGRFTKEDFEAGHLNRPNGKQTGKDQLDDKAAARRYFNEIGDPRGQRPAVEIEDDDVPE